MSNSYHKINVSSTIENIYLIEKKVLMAKSLALR